MWEWARIQSDVGVGGVVGKQFVLGGGGFVSLSPLAPLLVRNLARGTWPPSGGHGNGNWFKNSTQNGFHSLQLSPQINKERKGFFFFWSISFFILFGSWHKWPFLRLWKSRFLGEKCHRWQAEQLWAQRICCACKMVVLTISLLGSELIWLASAHTTKRSINCRYS